MPKLIFSLILFASIVIRLYNLGSLPVGLHRDEASLGYNAYSILQTGQDEYDRFLPLGIQSFGDWKLPGYVLGAVPFVALFGLTEFSTRLFSALAGCVSAAMIYLIVKKIFAKEKFKEFLALLSMAFFAFLPWNIFFSRASYEANVALCLFLTGYYFFLRRFENNKTLIIAGIFWGVSFFTYHASHVFIPIFYLSLILVDLWKFKWSPAIKLMIIIFFFLIGANVMSFLVSGDRTKLSGIGIFADKIQIHQKQELPRVESQEILGKLTPIFHYRGLYFVKTFVINYLDFFSPQFLVSEGGSNIQHNLPGEGNLTYVDYILMFAGIYLLLTRLKSYQKYFFPWLFVVPIAAAITKDAPHYTRSIFGAGLIPIFSALGLLCIMKIRGKYRFPLRIIGMGFIFAIYFLNFLGFLDSYFIRFPKTGAQIWNANMKAISQNVISQKAQYDKIIFADTQSSPYIFLLFFEKSPPDKYQTTVERYVPTYEGFINIKNFDKYYFADQINWDSVFKIKEGDGSQKLLFIDKVKSLPDNLDSRLEELHRQNPSITITKRSTFPDGTPDFISISINAPANFDWKTLVSHNDHKYY